MCLGLACLVGMAEQGHAESSRNKKAPPKAGLEPERFRESVLVSTPEVVSRTPHTHRSYGERKRMSKGLAVAVSTGTALAHGGAPLP